MCGRFVAATDPDGLTRFLMIDERQAPDDEPNYNVAPTQSVCAAAEHDDRRHLVTFRWGLVPSWAKDPKIGNRMINARAESAAEKNAFKSSLRKRRCLIPADAFYEWQRRENGGKRPYLIYRADEAPLTFAGLWSVWRDPNDPEGEFLHTCTVLTTSANETMRELHDRMPVILEPASWDRWLDRDLTDPDGVRDLLAPADDRLLAMHPVSTEVNNPRNNHPGLLEPVDPGDPVQADASA
ncbi:SOS response-associated peptidase [Egibacter rhizosphaerae]|uniref:Abasic site processing protein n=1 Tax=Egibacter rhizosphaerae TaxID=1670831 RepID=A0A411YBU7_9ACTN|nr:SOS response-associated peptidase [Egibacter rhizosphaerae]QBI18701.1 SOS response-associated peptidase [Egibacter rhizosphaerae]